MAKATSINIQPIKANSELHNTREKTLDYVKSELSHLNESWQSDTIANRLQMIKGRYTETTGQQMQKKSTPIREGVVVINKDTSLNQLHKFANRLEERFGIKTIQIYTHKDEGHINAKEWKANLHAHFVFDWTQNNGKSIKLNKQDMAEMQTMLAETLEMSRGKSSDVKHLSSIQYKNNREREKLELLKEQIKHLKHELKGVELQKTAKKALFKTLEKISDVLGKTTNDKEKEGLKKDNEGLNRDLERIVNEANKRIESLKADINSLQEANNRAIRERDKLRAEINIKNMESKLLINDVKKYAKNLTTEERGKMEQFTNLRKITKTKLSFSNQEEINKGRGFSR